MKWCEGSGYYPRRGSEDRKKVRRRITGLELRGHFMLNQSLTCKDKEIQICSSKIMSTLVAKSGFSLDPSSESLLNVNWKSEFPSFLYRAQSIGGQKRIVKK